jgi:hypothetical protein
MQGAGLGMALLRAMLALIMLSSLNGICAAALRPLGVRRPAGHKAEQPNGQGDLQYTVDPLKPWHQVVSIAS